MKEITQYQLSRETPSGKEWRVCWLDGALLEGQKVKIKNEEEWWIVEDKYATEELAYIDKRRGWNNNI